MFQRRGLVEAYRAHSQENETPIWDKALKASVVDINLIIPGFVKWIKKQPGNVPQEIIYFDGTHC